MLTCGEKGGNKFELPPQFLPLADLLQSAVHVCRAACWLPLCSVHEMNDKRMFIVFRSREVIAKLLSAAVFVRAGPV